MRRVVNCLVAEYLEVHGYCYSLNVFQPEAGIAGKRNNLSATDVLQVLRVNKGLHNQPLRELIEKAQSDKENDRKENGDGGEKGIGWSRGSLLCVLVHFVAELCQRPDTISSGIQTDCTEWDAMVCFHLNNATHS